MGEIGTTSDSNKRIAKNTILLYFRMILTMLVSLYTVRVVLNTLGVVDYGIYGVVGGIVTMFAFLSNSMASASQRFFSFDIGQNNEERLRDTFNITVSIYIGLAIAIFLILETAGIWFLYNKMNIPADRLDAASWVLHFSILSYLVTMFSIPYNALIIAREKMSVYAYVSIVDSVLKLLVVYLLVVFSFDKLKLYAILIFIVTLIVSSFYIFYCLKSYKEARYRFYWNKSVFFRIMSYSGWNLFGSLAAVLKNQGVNIILNIFFGPAVNAARSIAYQLSNAINNFAVNFYTAVRPQIIKYYANNQKTEMMNLIFQSSRFSYFLLLLLCLPALFETSFLLNLWLDDVSDYTVLFTRLVIINVIVDALSNPLMVAAQATGKIKVYQLIVGGVLLLNLPISYLFLKLGFQPESTMYISIIISVICQMLRVWILRDMIGLSVMEYQNNVLWIVIRVSIMVLLLPFVLSFGMADGLLRFLLITIVSTLFSSIIIYRYGFNKEERLGFINILNKKLKKK